MESCRNARKSATLRVEALTEIDVYKSANRFQTGIRGRSWAVPRRVTQKNRLRSNILRPRIEEFSHPVPICDIKIAQAEHDVIFFGQVIAKARKAGWPPVRIASRLNREGYLTPWGAKWCDGSVMQTFRMSGGWTKAHLNAVLQELIRNVDRVQSG